MKCKVCDNSEINEVCEGHQLLADKGYVALVGVNKEGERTGDIIHMEQSSFCKTFHIELDIDSFPMYLIADSILTKIKKAKSESIYKKQQE